MLPRLVLVVFLAISIPGVPTTSLVAQEVALPEVRYPRSDEGLNSLEARKKSQLDSASQLKVFYKFHFTDELKQSGITFHHHALPYATEHYIANHYDHGTGVAVADVDGDGLYDLYFVNQVGGNELWNNLGNGKFKNITDEAGVGLRMALVRARRLQTSTTRVTKTFM